MPGHEAAGLGPAMLGIGLVYAGLLVAAVGAIALLHPLRRLGLPTRRRAAAALGLGVVSLAAGALLPAPAQHAVEAACHLDRLLPTWQFAEHHEIRIAADAARVDAAIREVTAREVWPLRPLIWVRGLGRGSSTSVADEPLVAVGLRSGFHLLAELPGSEIVIGTLVVAPAEVTLLPPADLKRLSAGLTAERFQHLDQPGYVKAGMNFRLVDEGPGRTRLITETRVFATDDGSLRAFAPYWRLIYPGSSFIRRLWLRAIRERAEATPRTTP